MSRYVKRIVENLTKKYNTFCPFELANQLNILIVVSNIGKPLGIYKYIKKNRVIFLNEKLTDIEQKFVLAHELGHAVLHTKSSCFFSNVRNINKSKKEFEANVFAAELLINEKNIDFNQLQFFSIQQLSSYYEVPIELVELKFRK